MQGGHWLKSKGRARQMMIAELLPRYVAFRLRGYPPKAIMNGDFSLSFFHAYFITHLLPVSSSLFFNDLRVGSYLVGTVTALHGYHEIDLAANLLVFARAEDNCIFSVLGYGYE
ncbi:hypothetical protein SUGI_0279910 [Cryptomeria japonica]|nr:hypothetical protein SUGI_0279910 [Cryptomeria japonica]